MSAEQWPNSSDSDRSFSGPPGKSGEYLLKWKPRQQGCFREGTFRRPSMVAISLTYTNVGRPQGSLRLPFPKKVWALVPGGWGRNFGYQPRVWQVQGRKDATDSRSVQVTFKNCGLINLFFFFFNGLGLGLVNMGFRTDVPRTTYRPALLGIYALYLDILKYSGTSRSFQSSWLLKWQWRLKFSCIEHSLYVRIELVWRRSKERQQKKHTKFPIDPIFKLTGFLVWILNTI